MEDNEGHQLAFLEVYSSYEGFRAAKSPAIALLLLIAKAGMLSVCHMITFSSLAKVNALPG